MAESEVRIVVAKAFHGGWAEREDQELIQGILQNSSELFDGANWRIYRQEPSPLLELLLQGRPGRGEVHVLVYSALIQPGLVPERQLCGAFVLGEEEWRLLRDNTCKLESDSIRILFEVQSGTTAAQQFASD